MIQLHSMHQIGSEITFQCLLIVVGIRSTAGWNLHLAADLNQNKLQQQPACLS